MENRYASHVEDVKHYTTERLRSEFLIEDLFVTEQIKMIYSHFDRIIVGGAYPQNEKLTLEASKEIGADYFLERREIGIINIGGKGAVIIDGEKYSLESKDGLYVGMGAKEIIFTSEDTSAPAKYYFNSAPAHKSYPTVKVIASEAKQQHLGSLDNSNKRTINKYIHPDVCKSCQLLMGMTVLEPQNVWNTMPCHTHERRMEVYFYFNIPNENLVFHYMGEPKETRHIVIRNEQAVISPSWSIHSGVGTSNYTFIWGMVGENQVFSDMDSVKMDDLK
jgi:4-deoxy-L-threo-5-hexosulose-uronate ketol-isomerase